MKKCGSCGKIGDWVCHPVEETAGATTFAELLIKTAKLTEEPATAFLNDDSLTEDENEFLEDEYEEEDDWRRY